MASKKKQKDMVFHPKGATTPTAADQPPACFVVPKPGQAGEGRMERSTSSSNDEPVMALKSNVCSSRQTIRTSGGLPTLKHSTSLNPHSDNLPSDCTFKGIRVTLDNNSMWNEFFRCKTEMILTQQGSRMFPYCRFRISGLQPSRKYSLIMDIQPLDNSRYRWTGKSWQVAGKAEVPVKSPSFAHPESPSTGQHWMQNPVSFYKMKLTNNISDQEGNTVLHPMHRYLPRLHVVPTDKAAKDIKLNGPSVVTFTFPQTEFMAVTSYQNSRFAQLKVDYNPFVKGLKEDVSSSWALKLKLNCGNDLHKDGSTTNEKHPVKKSLKSLLTNHKLRSPKASDSKPSVSDDLQENSTTNKDQSAAKVPAETQRTGPAQKLFSELIREAHVSLQRCDLDPLGCSNITEPTDGVTVTTTTAKKGLTLLKNKVKEEQVLLNPPNNQHKPEAQTEVNVKLHKRPRPLPLPALALFLKQHSAKSKKTKNNQDSRPPACPVDPRTGSQRSAAAFADLPADHATNTAGPLEGRSGDLTESGQKASQHAAVPPGVIPLNVTREAVESAFHPPSSSQSELKEPRTDDPLVPISVVESPDPIEPNGTPVLSNSEQPSCTIGMSSSTISSPLATSSLSLILSPPPDTVLPALNSPQTLTVRGPSTLLPDSLTNKAHCLLPDPECCSFGFEPLSPACSPEVLPPLPVSLALELDPNSERTPRAVPSEGFLQKEDDAASVFKWHTVLQPPEPYLATSFTTCQTSSQTLPLEPISSPLLPSPTLSHIEPQTHTSTSTPLPGPPSFQENEQSPPFTADLSPLTLQLPLSPTFSSLDGDGLSPTPSIADLVHFFSTNDDLGMGVDFSGTEAVAVAHPPPNTVDANAEESPQKVQTVPRNKPCKRKKKSRQQKLAQMNTDPKPDDSTYTSMQPNLEEVEEQLFISFTSKEALKLHIPASSEGNVPHPQMTLEGHVTQPVDPPENAESQELRIATGQEHLLRDLRLMKHKQVIHPVLQEVGLKMNLLDSTLAIDLQYLGVRLPLPPPGVGLEPWTQELPPSQGAAAAFVSRTGKTTDVTQIKGWRDKFSHSEAPPTASSARPEAGPNLEPKKNLSAFCSDMLDQYLESEGKLMDERASSFSPPVVPVVYELPTQSASYVRTLDSVLRKHGTGAADLISGFVPPSKRPRLSLRQMNTSRRRERKHRGPKRTRHRPEPTADPVLAPNLGPAAPNLITNKQVVLTPAQPSPSKHPAALPGPHRPRKNQLKVRLDHAEPLSPLPQTPTFKKRKKLKSKTRSDTLSHTKSTGRPLVTSKDLAPLDSDSELPARADQDQGPVITRATLRLKDLEDSVVWEGQARTSITAERATIALTSLFTLMGFVSENPTTPIQLVRRRAPPCLNEFCRLGCVCTALTHSSRLGHCGRPHCMFSCSCLKQTVVLLKNLEALESAPPQPAGSKRKRRRMKMAYVLKEADSVSQPAKQIRILWKRDGDDSDPDPVHAPEPAPLALPTKSRENRSCARSRVFQGKTRSQKQKAEVTSKPVRLKPLKQKDLTLKRTKTRPFCPPTGEPAQPAPSHESPAHLPLSPPPPPPPRSSPPPSPSEPTPKPSKRLIILAECKWASDADKNHVLRKLCEAMAQDRLESRFWIRQYLISPISQTREESSTDCCIQYRVHISRPSVDRERPAALLRPQPQARQRKKKPQQTHDHLKQVKQEAEPLEDWQREVEDSDIQDEEASTLHQVHDAEERSGGKIKAERKKKVSMALPFLTGISPAGFLSANRKQPGGTDHLVQVNGKLYPLAKIQLGRMGALHPANRLAAYLTGRVGSNRKQQGCPSSSPQTQTPAPPPEAVHSISSVLPDPPSLVPSPYTSDSGVQGKNSSVGSAAPGNSQLLIQVPAPVKVPVLGLAPPPSGQRMVLQLVQTQSGVQYYRKPDGKLVQLIPLSQLRPVNPKLPVQTGAPLIRQTSPQASVNAPPSSSSSSSFSGLKSFSVSALPTPLTPGSGFLSQKGTCTFKILPTTSNKDPLVFTCPRPPPHLPTKATKALSSFTLVCPHPKSPSPPANVISLKPSSCQGVELGVKTVSVSAVAGPGGGSAPQKPSSPQAPAILQNPSENTHRAVPPQLHTPGSEFTPVHTVYPPIEPEPARHPVDLDIICVDDEMGLVTTETKSMEVIGSSSGETENSSDMEDDLLSEEEKETSNKAKRHIHNTLERLRRVKLLQLFAHLRKELALSHDKTSKICTLNRAVQVIQDLRETEVDLKRKKRTLMEKRDEFLSTLAPLADKSTQSKTGTETRAGPEEVDRLEQAEGPSNVDDDDVTVEVEARSVAVEPVDDNSPLSNQRRLQKIMKHTEAQSVSAAFRALRAAMNSKHSSKTLLLAQALDQIMTLKAEMNSLKSLKILLKQKRDTYVRKISQRSGKSEHSVLRKLQYLSSKQKKMEERERCRAANDLPAATGGGASDSPAEDIGDDDIIIISSNLQQQTPQAPPTPISVAPTTPPPQTAVWQEIMQLSKCTFTRPAVSHKAPTAGARPRTIPNILSRSKNPTPPSSGLAMTVGAPPSACEAPPFHTLVPPEVLSVVGAALPGQSVLTLSPVMAGQTVLQMTPIPGTDSPLTLLAQQKQLIPADQPPPPLPMLLCTGSDRVKDQDQSPSQTDSSRSREGGYLGPKKQPEAGGGAETESLTSLLNEIVFLNQRTVSMATTERLSSETDVTEGGAEHQGHAHITRTLRPDSDTDNSVTMETEVPGPQGGVDMTQTGPTNGNSKGDVLTPPPLLQMKVGGVKVAEPTNSSPEAAEGRSVAEVGLVGGVAWRPMPRLVPLGLRGNAPS